MPGPKETGPTESGGPASSSASAGYYSDRHAHSNHTATLAPNELLQVVHERDAARDRAIQRVRKDAHDAVTRTLPNHLDDAEIVLQRETSQLFAKVVKLEESGKIRWDDWSQDWIAARPTFAYTDSTRPPPYSTEELLGHFDNVRRQGKRWSALCPAHDDRTPSLAIAEGDRGWLLKCWANCSFDEITHAVGLESQRMFFS